MDLRPFSLDELRSRITVLFQEPVRYNAPVSENISLGDLSRAALPADVRQSRRSGRS